MNRRPFKNNQKSFLFLMGLVIVLVGIFVPGHIVFAADSVVGIALQALADTLFGPLFALIGEILMLVSSFILTITGWIFDSVIKYTISDMAQNIGDPSAGVGGAITTAWATLRDVANICFKFVLLYAAFKAMFELNFGGIGTTIKNIIIVALLINFSLFFTKVVIDASNIVSVGFYQSIASTQNDSSLGTNTFTGISGGYMKMLKMQTWYSANVLSGGLHAQQIFLTGFMSSIFMLVSAVIFLIAGVMFATRFILLVFLMILSPLALIAFIIPGLNNRFWDWFHALINQSFFAPIFFALTWVAFKLGNALVTPAQSSWTDLLTNPSANQNGAKVLLLNYVLTTGFFVAALIIAKQMASKTAGFKQISGGIGTVALGGAAIAGRQTVGRAASRLSESQGLQNWASRSLIGQTVLRGTRGVAGGSFDARGVADTRLGRAVGAGEVMGIAGNVGANARGGFNAGLQRQTQAREGFAQTLTTDAQREAYANRQMSGIVSRLYTRQGSRSSPNSVFGAMGRSNRVVASRTYHGQLEPLQNSLNTLNNTRRDQNDVLTQLNQDLANLQLEQTQLAANTARTPQEERRLQQLNAAANVGGSILNIEGRRTAQTGRIAGTDAQIGVIQPRVNHLTGEINRLGIDNPNNQTQLTTQQQAENAADVVAGRAPRHVTRATRAHEQNY